MKDNVLHGKRGHLHPKILANPPTSSTSPTRTNSDLAKLIFRPEIALKHNKRQHKLQRCSKFASPKKKKRKKKKVSSANNKWDTRACHYSWTPTKKHDNKPLSTMAGNILLNDEKHRG
jgi:hypothetical protein